MLKKVSLELGGKNANIIFDDCDLEKAVETSIRSSFWNQGEVRTSSYFFWSPIETTAVNHPSPIPILSYQICLCGSRIYVQRAVYHRFLDAFVPQARALVVGDPSRAETHLGPLVSESHMHKVLGYVRMAEKEGGVIQCGGRRMEIKDFGEDEKAEIWGKGLSPTSRVMREEIFGPVVTVHPFDTEDEAVALANDSPYGLACCVWTESGRRARRCAERIKAGMTMALCYVQLNGRTSVSWVPIILNLTVHVFMYYYYFRTASGAKIWWKKYLTTMQIIQFIIDLTVVYFCSYTYFAFTYAPYLPNAGSCAGTESAAILGCALLSSYLVLFINFYHQTYKIKKQQAANGKTKKVVKE
ncbi:aldehyde dehydrogenase family-domain-containing protein [Endogone sp. FLAS-F59071]|nr:aldehyde dehydrogenase family-domain-containing protein [Endogone sp. FLAS-F59071]|eukprot:RUS22135.1 aldehyde dehydrogenase family-domain-containing protein [Endogone sp. FLAS-F59071]